MMMITRQTEHDIYFRRVPFFLNPGSDLKALEFDLGEKMEESGEGRSKFLEGEIG